MTIAILTAAFQPAIECPPDVRCITPSCAALLDAFGPSCNKVQQLYPLSITPFAMAHATHHCVGCGGYSDGTDWVHECLTCGAVVEPGALAGPARLAFCVPCSLKPNCGMRTLPALPRRNVHQGKRE
jgi:hypothetical protein